MPMSWRGRVAAAPLVVTSDSVAQSADALLQNAGRGSGVRCIVPETVTFGGHMAHATGSFAGPFSG